MGVSPVIRRPTIRAVRLFIGQSDVKDIRQVLLLALRRWREVRDLSDESHLLAEFYEECTKKKQRTTQGSGRKRG